MEAILHATPRSEPAKVLTTELTIRDSSGPPRSASG
jgi:hypothetical protein